MLYTSDVLEKKRKFKNTILSYFMSTEIKNKNINFLEALVIKINKLIEFVGNNNNIYVIELPLFMIENKLCYGRNIYNMNEFYNITENDFKLNDFKLNDFKLKNYADRVLEVVNNKYKLSYYDLINGFSNSFFIYSIEIINDELHILGHHYI